MANSNGHFQTMIDSILKLDDLSEHGRKHAEKSGINQQSPEDEKILREYADGQARNTVAPDYDPTTIHQDRLREDEYQKLMVELEHSKTAVAYATTEVAEREDALARLGSHQPRPEASTWGVFVAISTLILSISPTLHDRVFFTLKDEILNWGCSAMVAAAVAACIAWFILGRSHLTPRRNFWNWAGLFSGIGIGIALFVLRISEAKSWQDWAFAAGLSGLELSAVIGMEVMASELRGTYEAWKLLEDDLKRAENLLNSARTDLTRRQNFVGELESRKEAHIHYVAERWVRFHRAADVQMAAEKAILQGYARGIAENKGRLLGLKARL